MVQNTMEVGGPLSDLENNVRMKRNMQISMQNEQIHAKKIQMKTSQNTREIHSNKKSCQNSKKKSNIKTYI